MKIIRAPNHICIPVNGFGASGDDLTFFLHCLMGIPSLNGGEMVQTELATLVMNKATFELLSNQVKQMQEQLKNPAQYVKSSLQSE